MLVCCLLWTFFVIHRGFSRSLKVDRAVAFKDGSNMPSCGEEFQAFGGHSRGTPEPGASRLPGDLFYTLLEKWALASYNPDHLFVVLCGVPE